MNIIKIVQECIPWLRRVEEIVTIYDKGYECGSIVFFVNG